MRLRVICDALLLALLASTAFADIQIVLIDEKSMPYDLSSRNYINSPSNYQNSSSNYINSARNYSNSPSNYQNSPSNYENRRGGGQNLFSPDGDIIAYYTFGQSGIMNFFGYSSERVLYLPGGGHTRSVFSEDGWCGAMGTSNGQVMLGLTTNCLYRLLLANE